MVGKLCAEPRDGGSASGLCDYIIGYALAEKGASREDMANALDGVYEEAEQRGDLGVGVVWSPAAGGGSRPSSIHVRNCASLSTASLEIDADAMRNPGIRTSAMHFVWSWDQKESAVLSDAQVQECVGEVLKRIGLASYRSLCVTHRDTDNLHVHAAVGAVDPRSGLAFNRTGLHRKMSWALREVELIYGLSHDRGLAVVRDAGLATARVDWADKFELAAWSAKRREDRLERQERRSFDAYRSRDESFSRYVDVTLAPRLRASMELEHRRLHLNSWSTLHTVAARYGCEMISRDGILLIRDVGIGELRARHQRQQRQLCETLKAEGLDATAIDDSLNELRSRHLQTESDERVRKRKEGEEVRVPASLQDLFSKLSPFQDVLEAELAIVKMVEATPELVLADVTAHSSTFTREDIDMWLAARISDPDEIERLGDLVVRSPYVRILSADTMQPLMTSVAVLEIEEQLAADAKSLASNPSGIALRDVDYVIREFERTQASRRGAAFQISDEQRAALQTVSRSQIAVIEGLPGTGKTTIQGVVRLLGEHTGREVIGLALSQAAAERLQFEAGFLCYNVARAQMLEEGDYQVIPSKGIVVVDEAAMVDSRSNARILQLARERGTIVIEIGDVRQLQPIDFGSSFRILKDAARKVGTYSELREIQRQTQAWHRDSVAELADAISERDECKRISLIRLALGRLAENGAITWVQDRDEAIDMAVYLSSSRRAEGHDTLTLASDRDSVRHLCEEDRRVAGRAGTGYRYVTDGGSREFAPGDRLMFLQNDLKKRGLGVRNGDRGTVVMVKPDSITVQLDGRYARSVSFSPSKYRAFDHATATTVHKAQGASIDAAVTLLDRSASAELLFVAMSRSKREIDVIVPRSAFRDLDDMAEHIGRRITLKTTSQTYDEILEKTGGKGTLRVLNIEAQREALPLRYIYESEVLEPLRSLESERVDRARVEYAHRKRQIAGSGLPIEARLEATRDALRDMRGSFLTVYRDLRAQPFSAWLQERIEITSRVKQSFDNTQAQDIAQEQRFDRPFARAAKAAQNLHEGIKR